MQDLLLKNKLIHKMEIKKKNVLKMYNLPKKVFFCKKCTMSNQRPRIRFNSKGVCSACQFAEFKRKKNKLEKKEKRNFKAS